MSMALHKPRRGRSSAALLGLFAALACSESPTEPEATRDDADHIASIALASGAGLAGLGSGPLPLEVPCTAGGRRVLDGSMVATTEPDNVRRLVIDVTIEQHACAFLLNERRFETTGTSHLTGDTSFRFPSSAGEQPVVLTYELHETGEYTVTTDSHSITCSFDMTQRLEPGTNNIRITGTSCGHVIDAVHPLFR
jgi:hypothetical protein